MSTALDSSTPLAPPTAASSKAVSMKEHVETALATVFGLVFLSLAALVTVETASRKLFNISLQGADELGGYALAIGSTIAFSLALMGRNHIRVDVFHELLPRKAQAVLNWVSITSLAVFALFIDYVAFKVVADTLEYRSTAQTPWATPLIYPQVVWYTGLVIFSLVAVGYAVRASFLLFNGRTADVLHEFQPKSAKEELKEELDDLAQRHAAAGAHQ
jgi:TRAP-type C4-dicarboxylate transport system permease small subunit